MDAAHWPQGINGAVEKKARPEREGGLNCPRCSSTNTKFCYYNNYSLSQPRYFCKTCRRYWTQGGTLRNVPVGGGSRRKHRSSSSSSSSSKKLLSNLGPPKISPQNPKIHDGHDLNLAYNQPIFNGVPELVALPFALHQTQNPNFSSSHLPFMELLKSAGNYTSLVSSAPDSNSNPVFSSSFPVHEFKSVSLNGLENGFENLQSAVENLSTSSRIGFSFEESRPVSISELGQDRGQQVVDSNGYWNGVLPGASW